MIRIADIYTLTDFSRNRREHLKRLRATGRPEILTVNGKPALVVQDAKAYENQTRPARRKNPRQRRTP